MRTLTSAALLLSSTLLTSAQPSAQTPFDTVYGGTTLDVWMHPHPDVPGEFLVWTAEVGVRIRRFDTATGIETFEEIDDGVEITGALHGLFISDDLRWGFAVGSDGQAYWATDLSTPSKWRAMDAGSVAADQHLWESIWDDDWEGSVWEREAWLVGDEATFLHKAPGSEEFQNANLTPAPPAETHFMCIDFADPDPAQPGLRAGVAGSRMPDKQDDPVPPTDLPAIYYTTDGLDWDAGKVHLPTNWNGVFGYSGNLFIWAVDFVPGSTTDAYAVGGQNIGNGTGYAWYTEDGGANWYPLYHECNASATGGTCMPAAFVQPAPAPCTGQTLPSKSWGGIHGNYEFATLYDVTALPDGSAVATGYAGGVFECPVWKGEWTDRADTHNFGTQPLWGVSNATSGSVTETWLGGGFGDLRSSVDGGFSWQHEADEWVGRLQGISFGSDTDGWVTGQFGRIAKSSDGGVTWVDQYRGDDVPWLGGSLNAVHAIDANSAVAVGYSKQTIIQPEIIFTGNGGGTPGNCGWNDSPVLPNMPNRTELQDVDSYGLNPVTLMGEFWAVGGKPGSMNECATGAGPAQPVVLRSLDGGASWTRIGDGFFPDGFQPEGVSVFDQDNVVVVGRDACDNAMAYRSTDASTALTWNSIVPANPIFPALCGVDLLSPDEILAVGEQGAILRFDPNAQELTYYVGVYDTNGATYGDHAWSEIQFVPEAGAGPMIVIAGFGGNVLIFDGEWSLPHSTTSDWIRGISFRSKSLGWMTGRNTVPGAGVHTPNAFGDSSIVRFQQ